MPRSILVIGELGKTSAAECIAAVLGDTVEYAVHEMPVAGLAGKDDAWGVTYLGGSAQDDAVFAAWLVGPAKPSWVIVRAGLDGFRVPAGFSGKIWRYGVGTPLKESAWMDYTEAGPVVFWQSGQIVDSFSLGKASAFRGFQFEYALIGTLVGLMAGMTTRTIQAALETYQGMPHRLRRIGTFAGAEFYDDAYARIPRATFGALHAFAGERLHVVCGPVGPHAELAFLARAIMQSCVSVSLLPGSKGFERELAKVRKEGNCHVLDKARSPILQTVLSGIQPHMKAGDTVLLSPGTADVQGFATPDVLGDTFAQAVKMRYTEKS